MLRVGVTLDKSICYLSALLYFKHKLQNSHHHSLEAIRRNADSWMWGHCRVSQGSLHHRLVFGSPLECLHLSWRFCRASCLQNVWCAFCTRHHMTACSMRWFALISSPEELKSRTKQTKKNGFTKMSDYCICYECGGLSSKQCSDFEGHSIFYSNDTHFLWNLGNWSSSGVFGECTHKNCEWETCFSKLWMSPSNHVATGS